MSTLALVYSKTDAGRQELQQRTRKLSARARQVLVLIDGQRALAQLADTLVGSDVSTLVVELESAGLVAKALDPGPVAVGVSAAPAPLLAAEPIIVQREISSAELAQVKQLMADTARQHLGLLAQELVRRIQCAASAEQLRPCVRHWHLALRESRQGGALATGYLNVVRAVLG